MNEDLQARRLWPDAFKEHDEEIGRKMAQAGERYIDRHLRRLLDLPQAEEIIPGRIITYEGKIYFLEASVLRLGK